jgi:RimJ/RimL family protein N-acetyltransferase
MSNYITIHKKRSTCTGVALALLKQTVYVQNPDECPNCLWLNDITVGCKQKSLDRYQTGLQIFKTLFHSKDKSVQIALWNALTCFHSLADFDKNDFSDEEYALIMKAVNIEKSQGFEPNINRPIITKRLILRAITSKDFATYKKYFREDDDFPTYCGKSPTKENISEYASRIYPLLFAIEERKTHRIIGNVGLNIHDGYNELSLEYYIFKQFRHNGYCKEAALALIDRLLKHKLYTPIETLREYIYKKKRVKIDTVRAMIATTNEASKKVAQSIGMIHEATLSNRMKSSDFNWVNEEIYILPKK